MVLFWMFWFLCQTLLAQETFIQSGNEINIIVESQNKKIFNSGNEKVSRHKVINTLPFESFIRFEPPFFNFQERPVGMPFSLNILIWNLNDHKVEFQSITNSNPNFYSSKFAQNIVEPSHNTSFMLTLLSREIGVFDTNFVVNTSIGEFIFNVKGKGVNNPYRLKPYYHGNIPYDSIFTPVIALYNPYTYALQITEVWTSSYDFHLELPYGFGVNTDKIWRIPPFHTKPIVISNYLSKYDTQHPNVQNVYCFLSIKIDHLTSIDNYTSQRDPEKLWNGPAYMGIDDYLMDQNNEVNVILFEIELATKPGLYSPIDVYDFGTLSTYDIPKWLNLKIFNHGPDPVEIETIKLSEPNDAVEIDFVPRRVIPPNTKKPVWLGKLSYLAFKALTPAQSGGTIEIRSNSSQHSINVPYQANLYRGALVYDVNSTKINVPPPYYSGFSTAGLAPSALYDDPSPNSETTTTTTESSATHPVIKPIRTYLTLNNTFDFPLAISDVYIVQDDLAVTDNKSPITAADAGNNSQLTDSISDSVNGANSTNLNAISSSTTDFMHYKRFRNAGAFKVGYTYPYSQNLCPDHVKNCQVTGDYSEYIVDGDIWTMPPSLYCKSTVCNVSRMIVIPPRGILDMIYVEYQPYTRFNLSSSLPVDTQVQSKSGTTKNPGSSMLNGDPLDSRYITASLNIHTNASVFTIPISVYYGGLQIDTYNPNILGDDFTEISTLAAKKASSQSTTFKIPTIDFRTYPSYYYYYVKNVSTRNALGHVNGSEERYVFDSNHKAYAFFSLYNYYPHHLNLSTLLKYDETEYISSQNRDAGRNLTPPPQNTLSPNSKALAKSLKLCPVWREDSHNFNSNSKVETDNEEMYRERVLFRVSQNFENLFSKAKDSVPLRDSLKACQEGVARGCLHLPYRTDSLDSEKINRLEIKPFQVTHFVAIFKPLKFVQNYRSHSSKTVEPNSEIYKTVLSLTLNKRTSSHVLGKVSSSLDNSTLSTEETLKLRIHVRVYEHGFLKLSSLPPYTTSIAQNVISTHGGGITNHVAQNILHLSHQTCYPGKKTRFNLYIDNYYYDSSDESRDSRFNSTHQLTASEVFGDEVTVAAVKHFLNVESLPASYHIRNGETADRHLLPGQNLNLSPSEAQTVLDDRIFVYQPPNSFSLLTDDRQRPLLPGGPFRKRVKLKPFTKNNYIGQLTIDPSQLCKVNEDYCYTGLEPADPDYDPWIETFVKPFNIFDVDLPIYLNRLTKWKSLVQRNLDSLTTAFQIDTNRDQNILEFYVQGAHLSWPKLVGGTDVLDFPLTRVGNYSAAVLIIRNPSYKPLFLQILSLEVLMCDKEIIRDFLFKLNLPSTLSSNLTTLPNTSLHNSSESWLYNNNNLTIEDYKFMMEENPFELTRINTDYLEEINGFGSDLNDNIGHESGDMFPEFKSMRARIAEMTPSQILFRVVRDMFGWKNAHNHKLRGTEGTGSRWMYPFRKIGGERSLRNPKRNPIAEFHPSTLAFTLDPYKEAKFYVKFSPKTGSNYENILIIRNNLTYLEKVVIRGKGAVGNLKLMDLTSVYYVPIIPGTGGVRKDSAVPIDTLNRSLAYLHAKIPFASNNLNNVDYNPIVFVFNKKHLLKCGLENDIKVFPSFRKNLAIINSGNLPVKITSIRIESLPGPSFLFKFITLLECLPVPDFFLRYIFKPGMHLVYNYLVKPFGSFMVAFTIFYRLDLLYEYFDEVRNSFFGSPYYYIQEDGSGNHNNNNNDIPSGNLNSLNDSSKKIDFAIAKLPPSCRSYGFVIADCISLFNTILAPNQSYKVDLLFMPDFSVKKTQKVLAIDMTTNLDAARPSNGRYRSRSIPYYEDSASPARTLRYELLSSISLQVSKLCNKKVARPEWENALLYISVIGLIILVVIVLSVGYTEGLFRRMNHLKRSSRHSSVAMKILSESTKLGTAQHQQKRDENDKLKFTTQTKKTNNRPSATSSSASTSNTSTLKKGRHQQVQVYTENHKRHFKIPICSKRIAESNVDKALDIVENSDKTNQSANLAVTASSEKNASANKEHVSQGVSIIPKPQAPPLPQAKSFLPLTHLSDSNKSKKGNNLNSHYGRNAGSNDISFEMCDEVNIHKPGYYSSSAVQKSKTNEPGNNGSNQFSLDGIDPSEANGYKNQSKTRKNRNGYPHSKNKYEGRRPVDGRKNNNCFVVQTTDVNDVNKVVVAVNPEINQSSGIKKKFANTGKPISTNAPSNSGRGPSPHIGKAIKFIEPKTLLSSISQNNQGESIIRRNSVRAEEKVARQPLTATTSLNLKNIIFQSNSDVGVVDVSQSTTTALNLGNLNPTNTNTAPSFPSKPTSPCNKTSSSQYFDSADPEMSERSSTPSNLTYADVVSGRERKSSSSYSSNSRSITPLWDQPLNDSSSLVKNIDAEFDFLVDRTADFHIQTSDKIPAETDDGPVTPIQLKHAFTNSTAAPFYPWWNPSSAPQTGRVFNTITPSSPINHASHKSWLDYLSQSSAPDQTSYRFDAWNDKAISSENFKNAFVGNGQVPLGNEFACHSGVDTRFPEPKPTWATSTLDDQWSTPFKALNNLNPYFDNLSPQDALRYRLSKDHLSRSSSWDSIFCDVQAYNSQQQRDLLLLSSVNYPKVSLPSPISPPNRSKMVTPPSTPSQTNRLRQQNLVNDPNFSEYDWNDFTDSPIVPEEVKLFLNLVKLFKSENFSMNDLLSYTNYLMSQAPNSFNFTDQSNNLNAFDQGYQHYYNDYLSQFNMASGIAPPSSNLVSIRSQNQLGGSLDSIVSGGQSMTADPERPSRTGVGSRYFHHQNNRRFMNGPENLSTPRTVTDLLTPQPTPSSSTSNTAGEFKNLK